MSASLHSFTSNAYGRDANQGSFGIHDSTGAFVFSPSPLVFIPSSESLTNEGLGLSSLASSLLRSWDRQHSIRLRRDEYLKNAQLRKDFLSRACLFVSRSVGFKVNTYASKETTGFMFHTCRESSFNNLGRTGELESTELTSRGRTKIRRSIECAPTLMKYFWTLTFSPSKLHAWEKSDDGTVRQDYAKYKLKKFLNTAYQQQKRLARELLYVWVAEIQQQKTGNIHFHILVNQFMDVKWVTKVWAQEVNSVDIAKPFKNPEHASAYLRKYISKDQTSLIKGFRYRISDKLHGACVPKGQVLMKVNQVDNEELDGEITREFLDTLRALRSEIEGRGGRIMDFGFHIPKPRSSRAYINKETGLPVVIPGVDARLGKQITEILGGDPRSKKNDAPF